MKHKLAILSVTLALTTGLAMGQHPQHDGPRPDNRSGRAANRLDFLALRLNLTEAQKTAAAGIFTNASTAAAPVRTSLDTARTALRGAVTAHATGTQIDQLAATMGTLTGQLAAIDIKAETAFYVLLTDAQKALYDALKGPGGRGR